MKIINFISGKDLGGPKQSFILYSEVLSNLGHEVKSVIRQGSQLKEAMQTKNMIVSEVSYIRSVHPLFIKKTISKLEDMFRPVNAAVIFVHKQIDIELVRHALGNDSKIVGIIHGFNSSHTEFADVLIAVSEKVKQFLIDGGCAKPVYVIPNMVQIKSGPTYRDIPKTPLIGAMGIFRRKKGFNVFIKSLAILKSNGVPFRAVIAGKGRNALYLKYLRWSLDLTNELSIRGWVSNTERDKFIDSIDLYVLPSRTESFGMVVVEAMSRMKRVIATRCGGPEEIITDSVDGYLVQKQSPESIANKLEELIMHPELSNKIPHMALLTATEKYSTEAVSNLISDIINIKT